jgi:hypothetical protein
VAHAGVVAACSDGSVILAKKWSDVNCAGAVEVTPDGVPPIGSGIRPVPAAWANFLREQKAMRRANPSAGHRVDHASDRPTADSAANENSIVRTQADRRRQPLARYASSQPSPGARPSLTLFNDERRDLAHIVELSQRDTPAILEHMHAGDTTAVLQIAHSRAFEAQLRARQRAVANFPTGPVIVFSLEPAGADLVSTHLSFSQGGRGFRPGTGDPRELGWIDDDDTRNQSGNRRLGYIVLPESFEVSRPLAVFWGDAVVAATLRR